MPGTLKEKPLDGGMTQLPHVNKGLPRNVEFLAAAAGLVVLLPVLIICGLLVRTSSPGQIFFRQQRVGRGGRYFTIYKFRTMETSGAGPLITAVNDKRITPIGTVLRKWKLDELPELYNVLRGDMSFVGPRPEVPEFVDLSNPEWNTILSVRPGITDTVTLRLRSEEALLAGVEDKEAFYRETLQPYKMAGYLEYLDSRSAGTDLKIIAQTLKVVLFPGAVPAGCASELRPAGRSAVNLSRGAKNYQG